VTFSLPPTGRGTCSWAVTGKTRDIDLNFVEWQPNTSSWLWTALTLQHYLPEPTNPNGAATYPILVPLYIPRAYPGVDAIFYVKRACAGARLHGRVRAGDYPADSGDVSMVPQTIHLQLTAVQSYIFPNPDGSSIFQSRRAYHTLWRFEKRHDRAVLFVLMQERFGVAVGDYDKTKPLIIDQPSLAIPSHVSGRRSRRDGGLHRFRGRPFSNGPGVPRRISPGHPGAYQRRGKSCGSSIQQPDVFVTKNHEAAQHWCLQRFSREEVIMTTIRNRRRYQRHAIVAVRTQSRTFPLLKISNPPNLPRVHPPELEHRFGVSSLSFVVAGRLALTIPASLADPPQPGQSSARP